MGKAIFPQLSDLALTYKIKILPIDIDKNPKIKGDFLVFSAPTVLIVKDRKELLRESGFIDFYKIERLLEMLES